MEEASKLHIKIGDHEFSAEGPSDIVQAQFAAFKELISTIPLQPAVPPQAPPPAPVPEPKEESSGNGSFPHIRLEKIMKVEGRVVSLTAKCDSTEEAVMLVLLGQKEFRNNDSVTGSEVMDGLKLSGYILERVDKTLDKLAREGAVMTIGVHRARRYRMTNQGHKRALGIAQELLNAVL